MSSRILLVEDDERIRSSMRLALAAVREYEPEMVLCDIRLSGESGLDLCPAIHGYDPDCKVVYLTVYDDEQYLFQALRAGASGFLLKRVEGEELVQQLQRVREGMIVVRGAA